MHLLNQENNGQSISVVISFFKAAFPSLIITVVTSSESLQDNLEMDVQLHLATSETQTESF